MAIIERREHHQLIAFFTYEIADEDIIEKWGSVSALEDLLYEHHDDAVEWMDDFGFDRYDDLWTDRKGGYEIDWEIKPDEV
mgnify:CR=1 FL=1|jgi:hypothetical protein|tara:strand:+ start:2978 stop:3220 length:243 start_codon:yes stop_codon:yes gene_type:complete